ncbi:hypothetical protein J4727_16020 [Providencia rettgeri]|uniref:Uncharacterized protein n=1 Tax=Providencia rettgeri TaxID=587 RepID=A0A939SLU3_PRORE|nr:hypothetical protein [Providencia rettgeri]
MLNSNWPCRKNQLSYGQQTHAKLPENIQQALVESGNEAGQFLTDLVLQQEKEIIEKMKSEGVTVVEVDRALFKEKSKPFYNEFLSGLRIYINKLKILLIINPITWRLTPPIFLQYKWLTIILARIFYV